MSQRSRLHAGSARQPRRWTMDLESLERRDCPAATVTVTATQPLVSEAGGTATFTVSLQGTVSKPVTVGYALGGTARFASDYRLAIGPQRIAPSGSLTFAVGERSKVVTVIPVNDTLREGNESLLFNLMPPRNATLGTPRTATVTMTDDDNYTAVIQRSPADDLPGREAFTLKLSAPATQTETFSVSTSDGTAVAGRDYQALVRTPLVFTPGQHTKKFWVPVLPASTGGVFFVTADAASPGFPGIAPLGAVIEGPGIAPPATPELIVSDSAVFEGNSGSRTAVFTVMLSAPAAGTVTVDYATADGSAKVAGNDYQPVANTTLTFAPGETVKTVEVTIVGDTTLEADETYAVVLSNGVGAPIVRGTGLGTIRNDEPGYVPPPVPWTILVYMTGVDLNDFAFQDINEMEAALAQMSGGVRIVVSWDQPPAADARAYATGGGTQAAWRTYGRSVLKADTNMNTIASTFDLSFGERNTGDPATLVDFVKWATVKAPAERYVLQMWGHGAGLDGSQFDSESGGDALEIGEIRQALSSQGMPVIDVLAYDNCLMGMAEVGYAISSSVTGQFVASEELINGTGQDYTTAYQALAQAPQAVTPAMLTAGMVTSYGTQYLNDPDQCDTFSSVATAGYGQLTAALSQFVAAAAGANLTPADRTRLQAAANAAPNYSDGNSLDPVTGSSSFVDLGRFMTLAGQAVPALRPAAIAVNTAITAMVTAKTIDGRTSSGLSIYVPTGPTDPYIAGYARTAAAFCAATNWNAFATWMAGGTARAAGAARATATGGRAEILIQRSVCDWAKYGATSSSAEGDSSGSKPRPRITIVPQAARG